MSPGSRNSVPRDNGSSPTGTNNSSGACSSDTRSPASNSPSSEHLKEIVLLDGGFASQLSCHVESPIDGDVLWSARFLYTNPEAVVQTHLDFLRAGAEIVQTNTYQASVSGFMEHLNLSEQRSYELIKKAVELARTAVDRFMAEEGESERNERRKRPLIVGSVGPYGASLHDASEYSGSYAATTSADTMKKWHRPRIQALVEAGCDVLALETIPCRVEAEMLVEMIKEYPTIKAWLAFSCSQDGQSTAYGEPFQEVARRCYDLNPKQIVAVGVNCLAPRLVESLFSGLNKKRSKSNAVPLIVYPNSGESYNIDQGWIDRDKCEPVETYVHKWLDLGVTYIGGCCRTYAADVSRIGNEVARWRYQQKMRWEQQNDCGSEDSPISGGAGSGGSQ